MNIQQIVLARQPILDQNCETVAYELLYRDEDGCPPGDLFDGTSATCEVLINAYTGVYDKSTYRILPAFMNMNEDLLLRDLPKFASENLVLELSPELEISSETEQRIRLLANEGFKIALDNFVWNDKYLSILDIVDIIKIDALKLRGNALFQTLEKLSDYNVTLLAEKIENLIEFQRFKKLGFQLFQGYFFAYPQVMTGKRVSGSELIMMELLGALTDEMASPATLEGIISKDPRLAIRLLKLVNSASFSLQRSISSISEAVILLGVEELKRWALILSLSGTLDVPDELCRELLIRAKMCELLAEHYQTDPGISFLTGILSGADALFSIPLDEINQHIPLSDEITSAILHNEGDLGNLLQDVIHFSRYEWNNLSQMVAELELAQAQTKAIEWALESQKMAGSSD